MLRWIPTIGLLMVTLATVSREAAVAMTTEQAAEVSPAQSPAATSWTRVRGPDSVAPSGWRRTADGWELADDWAREPQVASAVAIDRLVQIQQDSEGRGRWLRGVSAVMQFVRGLSPVTLFATQVTLIALLVSLVPHRERIADDEVPHRD